MRPQPRFGESTGRMLPFLLGLILSLSLASNLLAARDASLPRYRLEVGQELVYELTASDDPRKSSDAKDQKGDAARNQMEWRIIVVGKNDDGSWRLLIRTNVRLVNQDGTVRANHDSLGYCDLYPDGSYSLDEQTAVFNKLFPYQLFCRLPDGPAALEDVWKYEPPVMKRQISYRLARRDGAHWRAP
jgi:hypothetical protein